MILDSPYIGSMDDLRRLDNMHWRCQEKIDGWRIVASTDNGRVRYTSKQGNDMTTIVSDTISEMIVDCVPPLSIIDGEWIRNGSEQRIVFFDVLSWGGKDLTSDTFDNRYSHIPAILPVPREALGGDFFKFYNSCKEGVVLKKGTSRIVGGRNPYWKKIRHADRRNP